MALTVGIADVPPVVRARQRIDQARLLVAGMVHLRDTQGIAAARGQLLRAALLLDGPAASLHPFAGAYVDGAAQARSAARLLGSALVHLSQGVDGEATPSDQHVVDAALRRVAASLERIEAARTWAYAGTHP